ncbi:hypothetical protein GOP47_0015588 [Adiantum capillus-veneris]|uniref:Uncharacterized protein n=1 Tax=Adiantum capillus-veneris TaxID=13818 RepID=A0A9D4UKA1_ADICA|nr:hypothetical protein GOP47_0015588 [Adiantum capillus-veneris]
MSFPGFPGASLAHHAQTQQLNAWITPPSSLLRDNALLPSLPQCPPFYSKLFPVNKLSVFIKHTFFNKLPTLFSMTGKLLSLEHQDHFRALVKAVRDPTPRVPLRSSTPTAKAILKQLSAATREIEKLSIAECRIYRKKHKMLDTSGDFFQRAGVDEELCYMRDIMEEEIQEDVNSQLEKWQYAITLLVKIRCELDALKI